MIDAAEPGDARPRGVERHAHLVILTAQPAGAEAELEPAARQPGDRGLYRFRTRRRRCDLRFGRMAWLHQDRGSWLFVCSI
jgi:hypothetical protein